MHLFFFSVLLVLGFPFIMSEVVNSFNQCPDFFFKEKPPMIKGILEESASRDNNRYKLICQRSKNIYRYATLYDTTNKIPVFSAYKYTEKEAYKTPNRQWMIEPQLEENKLQESKEMQKDMQKLCVYQACSKDYVKQDDLTRGHILPMSYAANEDTAKSTCTMTNIVPQKGRFNGGSWKDMEENVKTLMDTHCRDEKDSILAYVLTGAVPSQTNLMNNKVNIPSHMWTAFCCYNSKSNKWESQAHWAENIDESKDKGKTISKHELKDVQEFLKSKYNAEYTLFNGECLDPLNANVN